MGDSASSGSGSVRHSVWQHQTSPECFFFFLLKRSNKQAGSLACHLYGFSAARASYFWLVCSLWKLASQELAHLLLDSMFARVRNVRDSYIQLVWEEGLSLSLQNHTVCGEFAAAGVCWSLCSWVSTSDQLYERLRGMHLRNNSLCPPFLPRLSIFFKSVFMLPVHQLLGTSGSVVFREHSGRREESDRALLGSPLRCRPHRHPDMVTQSDKCVSAVPALPETGRGLT